MTHHLQLMLVDLHFGLMKALIFVVVPGAVLAPKPVVFHAEHSKDCIVATAGSAK